MHNLKKITCLVLLICFLLTLGASAYKIGDPIGKVLATDIVTYINDTRVPSFNIAGRTAVIVENLNAMSLPFEVNFDEATRTLSITAGEELSGNRDYFHFDTSYANSPVGKPVMNVLYTDIKTIFNAVELESFNIGGYTCVYADDLANLCGEYVWDADARTVNVYIQTDSPVFAKAAIRKLDAKNSIITKEDTFVRWDSPDNSYLIKNDDGTFTTLEVGKHINLETYDSEFNHLSSFAIKKELPIFGALLVGKDYNYIAFGQENLLDDPAQEVIRLVVYDKKFRKLREIPINNCQTAIPFDASGADMSEDDNYLVLHTGRSGYLDENGERPQTQLTVIIDKRTWSLGNILGKFQYNHTSHALAEFAQIDNGKIITATLSDTAPLRAVFLQELDSVGKVLKTQSLFNIAGPLGVTATGVMIGGFEKSDNGYFTTISTIDHTIPTGYNNLYIEGIKHENRDVYLLYTDKKTWELRHTCLARYTGVSLTASAPYLVKLDSGAFMVLWQQFDDFSQDSTTVCYALIDKDGNQLGATQKVRAQLSKSCAPIDIGGKVAWYVNTNSGRRFYTIAADYEKVSAESENTPSVKEDPTASEDNNPSVKEDSTESENNTPPVEEAPSDNDGNADNEEKLEEEKNKITEVDGI